MTQWATVSVLIEEGAQFRYETWKGPTIRSIHKAARARYPSAKVSFGSGYYQQSWGAH